MNRMAEARTILTIDVGNTAIKLSVMRGDEPLETLVGAEVTEEHIEELLRNYSVEGVACCRVGSDRCNVVDFVRGHSGVPFLELDKSTPVPITVDYDRQTLGNDRLAAAVGVAAAGRTVLLADAGTAITLDLTRGLRYEGGNISPGVRLRFEALNRFTQQLPLVNPTGPAPRFGHNTDQAIRSGVIWGLVYEVAGTLAQARELDPGTSLVVTGGNSKMLSKYLTILNIAHVIDPSAVGRGLARIYNFNFQKD